MKINTSIPGLLLVACIMLPVTQADITDDTITATNSLNSSGTLNVDGTTTFNGPVSINGAMIVDDGQNTPWTTSPNGAYWNTVLGDGFFVWGDPSSSSALNLNLYAGDRLFMWYPEKIAFRAVQAYGANVDEANIGLHSTAIGDRAYASGLNSVALGVLSHAYSTDSIAIGGESEASGVRSVALGSVAEASGQESIALGYINEASGLMSIAAGRNTSSTGSYSIGIGYYAVSDAEASIAIGHGAESHGNYSNSIGHYTVANAYSMTALGTYNEIVSGQTVNAWEPTDQLFVVGNGIDGSNRSNALVVYKNADASFAGNVEVAGDITLANPAGGVPMGNFGL